MQPGSGERITAPHDVQLLLQWHLDQVGALLRTAAQQLRSDAPQRPRKPAAPVPAVTAPTARARSI
ncbi:hypothetical protein [Streptomyces inhibens]|uniref:hypothetical protein n=1 Tax=Streptomyces inhibens TaxID=2293571 RepID=UPI000FFC7ED1|nr:hypothetical protein [Streptomyces inhibens]